MRIVMFYHSLISDWNHGNAHFLRGVAAELMRRGHKVSVYEPQGGWSMTNLIKERGRQAIKKFRAAYPGLASTQYDMRDFDPDLALDKADLVIVHEWNDPTVVKKIGEHRARSGSYRLFFHDTHHRAVTDREAMRQYDLSNYDGVLAFGEALRDIYLREGLAPNAWTWHEAADTRVFRPLQRNGFKGDLIWVGNWGDEERTRELGEYLLQPVKELGVRARVHGVRYPEGALSALAEAGIEYGGWLANYEVPRAYSSFKLTLHIPRSPYRHALPGIPTIRPFEALACGIPLISAPWEDTEGLFEPGRDFLVANNAAMMKKMIKDVLADGEMAGELAFHGLKTILKRHTCVHRVEDLFDIMRAAGWQRERTPKKGALVL